MIAICCDYIEYDSALEAARDCGCDYTVDLYDDDDNDRPAEEIEDELEEYALDWLTERTLVLTDGPGIIIQQF